MFTRTALTDQLQDLAGVSISTQIIPTRKMTANYRNVKNQLNLATGSVALQTFEGYYLGSQNYTPQK